MSDEEAPPPCSKFLRTIFKDLPPHSDAYPYAGVPLDSPFLSNFDVDWFETPGAHVFKANLPGVTKQDLKVQVSDQRVLSIKGVRTSEHPTEQKLWHRMERISGKFCRDFWLPYNANLDSLCAKLQDGVLTVSIPKVPGKDEHLAPRTVEIS